MNIRTVKRVKQYSLLSLAIIAFMAGVVLFAWPLSPISKVFGSFLIVISALFVGRFRKHSGTSDGEGERTSKNHDANLEHLRRPGHVAWSVGVFLLIVTALSFVYLFEGPAGELGVLILYLSTGLALACAVFWGYLIGKLVGRF